MKTVIMAGGRGTRISELFPDIPKPLIPIEGVPVLEREIVSLRDQGFKDIIMTVSHMGNKIMNHFGDGAKLGVAIQYYNEVTPLTYNISRNQQDDKLLNALKETNADVQIITNVPSRMERYYNSDAGNHMRMTARRNINVYISKLNPENFQNGFVPFFNVHNHAKIIGTEDIVYIGSANFSNESANNIETGVIIEDKVFIQKLYSEFFDAVKNESLSYYDESFSAFSLFVLSLYAKFEHHYNKIITNVYTDYERTKLVVAETIFISVDELDALYRDLGTFQLSDIFYNTVGGMIGGLMYCAVMKARKRL